MWSVSIVTCETSLHLIALVNWWMIWALRLPDGSVSPITMGNACNKNRYLHKTIRDGTRSLTMMHLWCYLHKTIRDGTRSLTMMHLWCYLHKTIRDGTRSLTMMHLWCYLHKTIRDGTRSLTMMHLWCYYTFFSFVIFDVRHTLMIHLVLSRNGEESFIINSLVQIRIILEENRATGILHFV